MSANPTRHYPCRGCGATLEYAPGQQALQCPYCGAQNAIAAASETEQAAAIEELDFVSYLKQQAGNEPTLERQTVKCPSCGAASQLPPHVTADRCPFCAAPLVAGSAYAHRSIQPRAIAPFLIKLGDARGRFTQWLQGLWFAPNALKQAARAENGLKGVYVPYWTFDANSQTPYVGERGDVYYESESFVENGQNRTRQVERIRWHSASGSVAVDFNDVLVPASGSVPKPFADGLAPWRLEQLTPYRDDYVSGFTVEAYQLGLEPGFGVAQQSMEGTIREAICRDIGGDRQRVLSMSPSYSHIAFKHILLPIWLSSYRYGDRTFRFLVNGQTGAVQGERPYSVWKLALAVVGTIIVLVLASKFVHLTHAPALPHPVHQVHHI